MSEETRQMRGGPSINNTKQKNTKHYEEEIYLHRLRLRL